MILKMKNISDIFEKKHKHKQKQLQDNKDETEKEKEKEEEEEEDEEEEDDDDKNDYSRIENELIELFIPCNCEMLKLVSFSLSRMKTGKPTLYSALHLEIRIFASRIQIYIIHCITVHEFSCFLCFACI